MNNKTSLEDWKKNHIKQGRRIGHVEKTGTYHAYEKNGKHVDHYDTRPFGGVLPSVKEEVEDLDESDGGAEHKRRANMFSKDSYLYHKHMSKYYEHKASVADSNYGRYHSITKKLEAKADHHWGLYKSTPSMFEEVEDLDEVLNIQQRIKRGQIIRRYKSKIHRAKELAQRKLAPTESIKKRAYAAARQIVRRKVAGKRGTDYSELGPAEKMMIDKLVHRKQSLVKRLAKRLMPRVKQAEQQRLHAFMKNMTQGTGHPHVVAVKAQGQGDGGLHEEYNELFAEKFMPFAKKKATDDKDTKGKKPNPFFAKKAGSKDEDDTKGKKPNPFTKKADSKDEDDTEVKGKKPNPFTKKTDDKEADGKKPNPFTKKPAAQDDSDDTDDTDDTTDDKGKKPNPFTKKTQDDDGRGQKEADDEMDTDAKGHPKGCNCKKCMAAGETDDKDADKKSKNSNIIMYSKFEEEVALESSAFKALMKKADSSGIEIEILGEIYDRGYEAWNENMNVSQQQYAFARINSFINKGKTYYNEDADLQDLNEDARASRLSSPHFRGAQKNTAELASGEAQKRHAYERSIAVKKKSYKALDAEYNKSLKDKADHHLAQYNHHHAKVKEHDEWMDEIRRDPKNHGFRDAHHAEQGMEEIDHQRENHAIKRYHHETKFHEASRDYEYASGKDYKKRLAEDVEAINEISKNTIHKYINRARVDAQDAHFRATYDDSSYDGKDHDDFKPDQKLLAHSHKRERGIALARAKKNLTGKTMPYDSIQIKAKVRATNEEVELDETRTDHYGYEIKGNSKPWGLYHTQPNKPEKLFSKHPHKEAAHSAKWDQLGMGACAKGEKFTVKKIVKEDLDESNNTPHVRPHYGFTDKPNVQSGWKASNKHGKVKYFGKDFKAAADRHAGLSEGIEPTSRAEAMGLLNGTHLRNRYGVIVKKGEYADTESGTGAWARGTFRSAKPTVKEDLDDMSESNNALLRAAGSSRTLRKIVPGLGKNEAGERARDNIDHSNLMKSSPKKYYDGSVNTDHAKEVLSGKIASRAAKKFNKIAEEIDNAFTQEFSENAKSYKNHKNYVGYDKHVETPSGKTGAHVFEFDTDKEHKHFLDHVGGAPHPLGGRRAIIEEVRTSDYKGVVVRRTDGTSYVRKQKVNKKIIGSGDNTDGKAEDEDIK